MRLWYALPSDDRQRRLADMFRSELGAEGRNTQFRFMGAPVCRQAFIALTGIYATHLQDARNVALGNMRKAIVGYWDRSKTLAYMNARAWLLQYSKAHGDTSPLNTKIILPVGWKHQHHATYYRERVVQ